MTEKTASGPRPHRGAGRRRAADRVTPEAVLPAARARFAAQGYDGTTLRDVAEDVGVDPALVVYLFGSKSALFSAAMQLPVSPAAVLDQLLAGPAGTSLDDLADGLSRAFLDVWDDPVAGAPLIALVRSAAAHPDAARLLTGFIDAEILDRLARTLPGPDPRLRASLLAAHLLGLVQARYVLRLEPLASSDRTDVAAGLALAIRGYL